MRIVTVNGRSFFFESSSSTDNTPQNQPITINHITDEYLTDQNFFGNGYSTEHYFDEKRLRSDPSVEDKIITEQRIMDKDLEFKLDENAASQPSGDKYGEIVIIVVI